MTLLGLRRAASRPLRPPQTTPWLAQRKPPTLRPRSSTTRQASTSSPSSRAERIVSKLPSRLQRYTSGLRKAPLSHIIAFLILHEITAIVPLLGLWGFFHYTDYVPLSYVTSHWGQYVRDGVQRAERYFRRKRWFGFGDEVEAGAGAAGPSLGQELATKGAETEEVQRHWGRGGDVARAEMDVSYTRPTKEALQETEEVLQRWANDEKYRVVIEVALAWAVTKALLPVRIVVSVWATPWFAGVMGAARRILTR